MSYSDRQAPVQVLDNSTPTGFRIEVVDSGDVDLSGIELDGQIAATDNLQFDFSAGLLDPKLYDVCANNGDFLFPGPAESSYSLGLNWAKAISGGNVLSWALNYAWVGKQQTHPGGTMTDCGTAGPPPGWPAAPAWFFDSRYELPDYGLLNGRVSLASANGDWIVTLYGNNLTDEVYANYATRFGGGFWDFTPPWVQPDIQQYERSALGNTMGRPRELGVSFQYNFGER
jgi:iron complex outermembrane receptor protein